MQLQGNNNIKKQKQLLLQQLQLQPLQKNTDSVFVPPFCCCKFLFEVLHGDVSKLVTSIPKIAQNQIIRKIPA